MPQKTRSKGPQGGSGRSAEARARAQARREQIARQERNRRLGFVGLWTTLGVVVVLVIVLVVVFNVGRKNDTKDVNTAAPAALVSDLATVPASTFQTVGATGLGNTVSGLQAISGGTPVLTGGKPTFIYVGGEFCPYCAAQRWVITTTLDRFGTFTGLQTSRSAADDGNYATLTFAGATYTSQYVAFDGKEIYDRARKNLETLSTAAQASYSKYGQVGSVPYFTVNNAYKGTYQFDPAEIGTLTAAEVASQINAGQTQLGKDVLASSNILTAAICKETGNKPAAVCTAPEVVTAGSTGLAAASSSSGSNGG